MRTIRVPEKNPKNCSGFSDMTIIAMGFVIFFDTTAVIYPLLSALKGVMWSWTPEVFAVVQQHIKLLSPSKLREMLWFEKHCWNVKHSFHDSKNIRVYLLTHYFLSRCIKIHIKQFHSLSRFFNSKTIPYLSSIKLWETKYLGQYQVILGIWTAIKRVMKC